VNLLPLTEQEQGRLFRLVDVGSVKAAWSRSHAQDAFDRGPSRGKPRGRRANGHAKARPGLRSATRRRIKLAESAAPPELADHATVYLLFWYGVGKSARPKENADDLATFPAGPVRVLGFEEGDAREAGGSASFTRADRKTNRSVRHADSGTSAKPQDDAGHGKCERVWASEGFGLGRLGQELGSSLECGG
jgi:hypothetical protein